MKSAIAVLSLIVALGAAVAPVPAAKLGALVFQGSVATEIQQLSPTIDSLKPHVQHVFLCQPASASRDMENYMSEWSRYTGIASVVHKGTRNACLRVYWSLAPPTVVAMLLVEWNMRVHVNGTIPLQRWYLDEESGEDTGADYAVAPDQSGLVLDWSPFLMRVGARCGYLGRFICVDNDVSYRHLLQVDYELDVDKETRELIERDAISIKKYPPPVLVNVYIARSPPNRSPSSPPEPPTDPEFAYAWYWMGRECEMQMAGEMARLAYTRRLELAGSSGGGGFGDMWYALYRLGDTHEDPSQAIRLLLEAYELQPRRREPLAALVRRYAEEGKYALCKLFASIALAIPFPVGPETGPHVEVPVYEWMVADEYSICLARLGYTLEAAQLAQRVLESPSLTTLPVEHAERIRENIAVWKPLPPPPPLATAERKPL
jgi:hypothetical protein